MNKENIFEELNKMKNLMVAKAGTVVSEQANNVGADVGTIMRELDKTNSDEQKIVNIIKKYKSKSDLQNFLNQYKNNSGTDFGVDMYRAIQPYNDKTEWNDLKAHLAGIGVTLDQKVVSDPRKGKSSATFTGLGKPATTTPAAGDRQKNINNIYCSVKNGIITNPSSRFKNTSWESWKTTYKPTDAEIEVAKKSCPTTQISRQRKSSQSRQSSQSVNDRFTKSVSSLGVQNGKMDLQTLQTILKSLEGGEISQKTPTQGTPDLAQLTAALNQLNANA